MPTIRVPFAEPLTNRDSSATKDSKLTNCFVQNVGGQEAVIKRPGLLASPITQAIAQGYGISCMNNSSLFVLTGTTYTDNSATIVTGWTPITMPVTNNPWYSLVKGTPGLLAVGGTASAFSTDGITFTSTSVTGTGAAWGAGLFVVTRGSTSYSTSPDGVNWTTRTAPMILGSGGGRNVILYDAGMFLAWTSLTAYATSPDGITWTAHSFSQGSAGISGLTSLNGKFLVITQSVSPSIHAVPWTSSDGINWTSGIFPNYPSSIQVTAGGGKFVAFSDTSPISTFTSSNGLNWSVGNSFTPTWTAGQNLCMGYCNGVFFVTEGSNAVSTTAYYTSTDGSNFIRGNFPTAIEGAAHGFFQYFNGMVIAPAYAGTTFYRSQGFGPVTGAIPNPGISFDILSPCSGSTVVKSENGLFSYSAGVATPVPQSVISVTVINAGTGGTAGTYALSFSGGGGTGAAGTYTIAGGSIISTAITSGGTGYVTAPTVSFPSGGIVGATGAVVLNGYPTSTVPGLAFLDSTYYVMDHGGTIYGSNLNDPLTWSPLNTIVAGEETDCGVAISRQLNYIVAFKERTTEFFYDAGNPTGSPLSSVPNAYFRIGCASASSIAKMENMIVWMAQTSQKGRQIMALEGFQPQVISTSEIDRILNEDTLSAVYSFAIRTNGALFYVLTLKGSNQTIVYDFSTKQWHFWTSMIAQTAKAVTSLTYTNGIVTVSQTAHGYSDGDLVTIAGATPSGYNGDKNITYIDGNTYSYPSASILTSPATGTITATGYTETYFNKIAYTSCGGSDYIQGEADGLVYIMSPTYYSDNNVYINTKIRTVRVDGGDAKRKFNSKAELIGDKVSATAYLRYTDDDYQTYCNYRPVSLAAKRSMINRLGHTRRRAYEIRITDNQPVRLGALELDFDKGTS